MFICAKFRSMDPQPLPKWSEDTGTPVHDSDCSIKRNTEVTGVLPRAWGPSALLLVALGLLAQTPSAAALSKMDVAFFWDHFSFAFDSDEQRQGLIDRGTYVPGEAVSFDVDVDPNTGRVFLTMPHTYAGSPVSLATVQNTSQRVNPTLVPYPDWSWHAGNSGCDGMTSVFRTHIDHCGRLWVIDAGDDMSQGIPISMCAPQLLVFDLATDSLIARHRFLRSSDSCSTSLMISVVAEQMGDTCSDDVYAYVADAGLFSIFVFHLQTETSWRVRSDYFYPDVNSRDFMVAGTQFAKLVGVLGIALSPCLDEACSRYLFFHPFAGRIEGRVLTSVLRNSSLYEGGVEGARPYVGVIGRRDYQAVGQAMSRDGVLFFGQVGEYTLNCWNIRTPYSRNYIEMVEYDYNRIRIQMGVKVVTDSEGEEVLWSISNNIQHVFAFDFTPNNTYPIYVLKGRVKDLIAGTLCEKPGVLQASG